LPNKICIKCNTDKPTYLFNAAGGNASGISNRCKECDLIYQKEYRNKNRKLVTERDRAKRNQRKLNVVISLGNMCSVCLKSYPIECYDLHHVDPKTKEYIVSMHWLKSIDKIESEVAKCVLVCANCHRTLHKGVTCE